MENRKHRTRTLAWTALLAWCVMAFSPAWAEEEAPSAEASVSFLSAYIWRGQELSRDSIVIQPSMTMSYKGFSAGLWANLDTDPYSDTTDNKANWNETDLTLSYGREFGLVSAELGYIYYALEDGLDDSQEFYLGLRLDTILSPSLTIFRDMASYPHWYVLLGVSHGFELTETMSLELSGSVSYLKSEDSDDYSEYNDQLDRTGEKFDNFHDGLISASLPIALGKYVTISPMISYVFPLSTDAKNHMKALSKKQDDDSFFYGGVTASFAF